MSKKNIIIIGSVILIIAIILIVVLAMNSNKETIIIERYDKDMQLIKTIKISNKKKVKEIKDICNNVNLNQDDMTSKIAINTNVKLIINTNKYFVIDLAESYYCYYVNDDEKIKTFIKMPKGLFEIINDALEQN